MSINIPSTLSFIHSCDHHLPYITYSHHFPTTTKEHRREEPEISQAFPCTEMVKSEQKTHSSNSPQASPATSSGASSSSINKTKKKYKGVRMRSWGSWVSEIRAPNQKTRIWLGSYSTAEAAARAYDAALLCIKGSSATSSLNFPTSTASHYGIPHDGNPLMSPKSIQRVAAAAAAAVASGGATGVNNLSPPPASMSPSTDDSSPSMSYSPPLDDVSPAPEHDQLYETYIGNSMATIDSWCNFESPKYVDLMVNGAPFDTASANSYLVDDFFNEEGDIRLWSFC